MPAPKASSIAPLVTWLMLQLGVLVLIAADVRISRNLPRPPNPTESIAAHTMLVVQLLASAMLFPWLLRTWTSTAIVIAATWPMLQFTGLLSAVQPSPLLVATLYISLWLLAMRLWHLALPTDHARLIASAGATLLVLLGPVLSYLHLAYDVGPQGPPWNLLPLLGPLPGALEMLSGSKWGLQWWIVGTALLLPLALVLLTRLSRQFFHTSSTAAHP